MPLSTTDPDRYADAGIFSQLSLAISNGAGDYVQTFATEGEAIQFSQRFYMWRKALRNRSGQLQKTLAGEAINASLQIYNEMSENSNRINTILQAAEQCKIQRPRGSSTITMTLAMDYEKANNTTALEFITKHAEKIQL